MLGSASALAMIAPAWPGLVLPKLPAPALVLADLRYGDSLGFAAGAERAGAELAPLVRNLGEIWFETVKPRLPGLQVVTGLTLDSDFFILTRLAEGSGAVTAYTGTHDWRSGEGSAHALSGILPLDGLSEALANSQERWAERLGSAVLKANWIELERNGPKQNAALQLKQPAAADSPRYFVSWLLRWAPKTPEVS
jgi:hypothetical protein